MLGVVVHAVAVGRVQQCPCAGSVIHSHVAGVVVVAVEWHVLVCVCVPVKPTRGNTT